MTNDSNHEVAIMVRFALLASMLLGSASAAIAYPPSFTDVAHVTGLSNPVAIAWAPDGRLFIAERGGRIRIWDGTTLHTALTLSVELYEEQGLLGMAIDPGFPNPAYLYALYSPGSNPSTGGFQRISRFTVSGNTINPGSEVVLHSTLPVGFAYHVGGCLRATASGHLYASNGENGWNTGYQHAQDLTRLEGKLIRINLDGSIPTNNPFVGVAGAKPEIFHRGLRNPFRFAIQPGTSQTFISEVGSSNWEEINTGPPGSNFGWPNHEGAASPLPPGVTNPLYAYTNSGAAAIVGCAFYTGGPFPPEYDGNFFFLDHVRGHLGRVVLDGNNNIVSVNRIWGNTATAGWGAGPVDLAMGPDGALYYTTYAQGWVRRVAYTGSVDVPPAGDSHAIALAVAPNPVVSSARIRFAVRLAGRAQITLHDLGGRRVRTLLDAHRDPGPHQLEWDGKDGSGRALSAGVYLVRLESGNEIITHRAVVTR